MRAWIDLNKLVRSWSLRSGQSNNRAMLTIPISGNPVFRHLSASWHLPGTAGGHEARLCVKPQQTDTDFPKAGHAPLPHTTARDPLGANQWAETSVFQESYQDPKWKASWLASGSPLDGTQSCCQELRSWLPWDAATPARAAEVIRVCFQLWRG